jgi:hypothetical protein
MRSKVETLTKYYPSLHQPINTGDDLFPIFRSFCRSHQEAFCRSHQEELIQIVWSRTVQTNKVSPCAYLHPVFAVASAILRDVPLALIDVGSSVAFKQIRLSATKQIGETIPRSLLILIRLLEQFHV